MVGHPSVRSIRHPIDETPDGRGSSSPIATSQGRGPPSRRRRGTSPTSPSLPSSTQPVRRWGEGGGAGAFRPSLGHPVIRPSFCKVRSRVLCRGASGGGDGGDWRLSSSSFLPHRCLGKRLRCISTQIIQDSTLRSVVLFHSEIDGRPTGLRIHQVLPRGIRFF